MELLSELAHRPLVALEAPDGLIKAFPGLECKHHQCHDPRRQFEYCIPSWIQRKSRVQANWSTTIQTLEGYTGWVSSVAFSLDGKLLPTLLVSNDWLVEGGTKIVWLPPNYRSPSRIAVWNRSLVLAYSSGQICVLRFHDRSKVL